MTAGTRVSAGLVVIWKDEGKKELTLSINVLSGCESDVFAVQCEILWLSGVDHEAGGCLPAFRPVFASPKCAELLSCRHGIQGSRALTLQ